MSVCAQAFPAFWILWHHIAPGEWWTAGLPRRLPASAPPCPPAAKAPAWMILSGWYF